MTDQEPVLPSSSNADNWVDALQNFLLSPPPGVSSTLLQSLSDAVYGSHSTLPPRVFYEAVQQSPVAISITDLDATIIYTNAAFSTVTGYSQKEILNHNESVLSDQNTPSIVYKNLWQSLQDKRPWSGILVNRRKDGERYLADLTIAPVLNNEGNTTHYLGMHRDVTEEHRLAQEVRNSKDLIESVVDAAPVVVALLNDKAEVIKQNQAYRVLTSEMEGAEPAVEFLNALSQSLGTSFRSNESDRQNFTDKEIRFDKGSANLPRWYSCSGTWILEKKSSVDNFFEGKKQCYLLLVAQDISAIKEQQEAVRMNALRALLAEEELVQSTRETLAGAIYQLQGPLNLISAANNMLNRRINNDESLKSLHTVLQQAMASGELAMETLRNCMPEEPFEVPAPVNINEILHEVLSLSTVRLLATGVVVDWQPTPVLPTLKGRTQRLRGLFKQLVDNAIDEMSRRGWKQRELRIYTQHPEEDIVSVIIEDTGPGIPEENRINVFEPFFSTKGAKGKRAGMGLTMVQDVVTEHAGSMNISSGAEGGCRIDVQLPVGRSSYGVDL